MALTYVRRRLSSTAREALYDQCRGDNEFPICNLCPLPVRIGEAWDESHVGAPHALGGTDVGVAHRDCNRKHGAEVVTPMVAKAKRGRQKFIGAFRTRVPMPCGRASSRSASIGGGVKPRLTQAQKHAAFLARRYGFQDAGDDFDRLDAQHAAVAAEMAVRP